MGAFLDGVPFRVNPTSVSWPYSVKLTTTKTMGGKVVQLYGVVMGDLVIEGNFGAGGPEEQKRFFDRLVAIIESQMPAPTNPSAVAKPVRFTWPERGWDFWCFVKAIKQANASVSISATNMDFNPGYVLTMFVLDDNGDLVKAAKNSAAASYIARLTAGMGWKQTEWNGPMGTLNDALQGSTLLDALFSQREKNFTSFWDQSTSLAQTITDAFVAGLNPPEGGD